MVNCKDAAFSNEMRARLLSKQAAKLAKEGRRAESEGVFRRAFEAVREVRGPLGNLRNDVMERSKLATLLADEAFSAGMGAAFAVEMWRLGCNSGVLSEHDRGSTDMFYPVELMDIAQREGKGAEEDAAPPAVCEVEKEKRIPIPWPIRFVVSNFRNLFFGEGEARKRENTGENE